MKTSIYICLVGFWAVLLSGCAYDNYEKPTTVLEGQVTYNGEPIYVSGSDVELELWQPGYDFEEKVPVYLSQDGSFQAKLFDGTYKLTQLIGSGPWVPSTDTMTVEVNGLTTVEFPVEPYYLVRDAAITANGGVIEATFRVEQINASEDIEAVALYLSDTQFVDEINNLANIEQPAASDDLNQSFTLSITPSGELTQGSYNVIYARIGVRTAGVADLIYSKVFEVEF